MQKSSKSKIELNWGKKVIENVFVLFIQKILWRKKSHRLLEVLRCVLRVNWNQKLRAWCVRFGSKWMSSSPWNIPHRTTQFDLYYDYEWSESLALEDSFWWIYEWISTGSSLYFAQVRNYNWLAIACGRNRTYSRCMQNRNGTPLTK